MNEPSSTTDDDYQRQTTSNGGTLFINKDQQQYSMTKHRSLFECCTCKQLVNPKTAKLMQCLHTICGTCFILAEKTNDLVSCQCCGYNSQSESIGDHELVKASFSVLEKCTNGVDNEIAEYKCIDCQDLLCEECAKAHTRVKLTKHHTLEQLHRCPTSEAYCETHENFVADQYCLPCNQTVCRQCCAEKHCSREHHMQPLGDHLMSLTQKSSHYGDRISQGIKQIESNVVELDEFESDFKQCLEQILKEISTGCQNRRTPYKELINKAQTYFTLHKQLECFAEALIKCPDKSIMNNNVEILRKAFNICAKITNDMSQQETANMNFNLLADVKLQLQTRIKKIIDLKLGVFETSSTNSNAVVANPASQSSPRCKTPPARLGQSPQLRNNRLHGEPNFLLQQADFVNSVKHQQQHREVFQQQLQQQHLLNVPAYHNVAQQQSRGRGRGRGGSGYHNRNGANTNANGNVGHLQEQAGVAYHQQQQPGFPPFYGSSCAPSSRTVAGPYGQQAIYNNAGVANGSTKPTTDPSQNLSNAMNRAQQEMWKAGCAIQTINGVPYLLDYARNIFYQVDHSGLPVGYPGNLSSLENAQRINNSNFLLQPQQPPQANLPSYLPGSNSSSAHPSLTNYAYYGNVPLQQHQHMQRHINPALAQLLVPNSTNMATHNQQQQSRPSPLASSALSPDQVAGAVVNAVVDELQQHRALSASSSLCNNFDSNLSPSSSQPSPHADNRMSSRDSSQSVVETFAKNRRKRGATSSNINGPSAKNQACDIGVETNWNDSRQSSLLTPPNSATYLPHLSKQTLAFHNFVESRRNSCSPASCLSAADAINASISNNIASDFDREFLRTMLPSNNSSHFDLDTFLENENTTVLSRDIAIASAAVVANNVASDDCSNDDGITSAITVINEAGGDATPLNCVAKQERISTSEETSTGHLNASNSTCSCTASPHPLIIDESLSGDREGEENIWEENCSVCLGTEGRMLQCSSDGCCRSFHMDHHVPQYMKLPKESFICSLCTKLTELKTPEDDEPFEKRHSASLTLFERKVTEHLLLKLFCHPDSLPFHAIDRTFYENFPQCSKRIDLTSIRDKLQNSNYECLQTFLEDINQIFINYDMCHKSDTELVLLGKDYFAWIKELIPNMTEFVQLKFTE